MGFEVLVWEERVRCTATWHGTTAAVLCCFVVDELGTGCFIGMCHTRANGGCFM
jgi:hypothetical protein